MDDRHRRGDSRLRERGRARTNRLSAFLPAGSLESTGLARAAFTTRRGGASRGPYRSFNLAYSVGDDARAVAANRRRLADLMGMPPETLVEAEQVHGRRVAVLASDAPVSQTPGGPIAGADALVTNREGIWISIYSADCVPVLVVDRATPAVGAAHAGWRGTAAGIVPEMIDRMREAFGTRADACAVELGPSIGGCCYEVDAPVARAMAAAPWWPEAARQTGPERWHLDLRTAIRHQLRAAGVGPDQIAVVPLCTACRADLFFSYRRDGVTGRMAACIGLRGGARG